MIDLLIADGWAVTGAAVSDATLEGVTAAGALAIRTDVTDEKSVTAVLEQAADVHGGVDLVVNAAAAYGGDRSGPFGGGPIAEARPRRFRRLGRCAGARGIHVSLCATGAFLLARKRPATVVAGYGRIVASCGSRARPVGRRSFRGARDHAGRRA